MERSLARPTRAQALEAAAACFDRGDFQRVLARRVAYRTESQDAAQAQALRDYLDAELGTELRRLGFEATVHDNPVGATPFLIARRFESHDAPTVLMYGHGDVVRGQDPQWHAGLAPWQLVEREGRLYGRGTADNKGQHSINLAALEQVLCTRGWLGFNVVWLFETGEETGSPGLATFCAAEREKLASDVLIASDGPRLHAGRPTVFLGSRGVANFSLELKLREGAHHSGNWGGLLRNPGTVMAAAIASLVDGQGRIQIDALRPPAIPESVREALADIEVGGADGDPAIDPEWGEPGLTPSERVFAWNTLEVLAFKTGNPDHPVNAIPDRAVAHLQLRFVVGTDVRELRRHVERHLAARGFGNVQVSEPVTMAATRLDPQHPWVRFALGSIECTTGKNVALLPNLGGSLPNDVFADLLGMPTVWIPHSYPACSQHAPNEHLRCDVAREALQIMAGLYWDIGEHAAELPRRAHPQT
jgi:acetylornithine deacetylase/succinyl-diaminopimelate desuccinylase-like protein